MEKENIARQLSTFLKEKLRLLENFLLATDNIKQALERHDISRVTFYTNERGSAVEKINQIDKDISAMTEEKGFSLDQLPLRAKDSILTLVEKIRDTLQSLSCADTLCFELAKKEHDSIQSDLLRMRRGMGVARGYGNRSKTAPRFLDIKIGS